MRPTEPKRKTLLITTLWWWVNNQHQERLAAKVSKKMNEQDMKMRLESIEYIEVYAKLCIYIISLSAYTFIVETGQTKPG